MSTALLLPDSSLSKRLLGTHKKHFQTLMEPERVRGALSALAFRWVLRCKMLGFCGGGSIVKLRRKQKQKQTKTWSLFEQTSKQTKSLTEIYQNDSQECMFSSK